MSVMTYRWVEIIAHSFVSTTSHLQPLTCPNQESGGPGLRETLAEVPKQRWHGRSALMKIYTYFHCGLNMQPGRGGVRFLSGKWCRGRGLNTPSPAFLIKLGAHSTASLWLPWRKEKLVGRSEPEVQKLLPARSPQYWTSSCPDLLHPKAWGSQGGWWCHKTGLVMSHVCQLLEAKIWYWGKRSKRWETLEKMGLGRF